jgi:ferrous iron transport protein B
LSRGLTVALAGNPNSGKTTIFNCLTGSRQHVANYPGVTVEIKEGTVTHDDLPLHIVDLPGTYSLAAYSPDEVAARDYLIDNRPDVVIHVVDSSNLERNLFLTVQLLELGIPLVIALNMSDVARVRGINIDLVRLSSLLGVPVIETVGSRKKGIRNLLDAAVCTAQCRNDWEPRRLTYGRFADNALEKLDSLIGKYGLLEDTVPSWWLAIRLLEGDAHAAERVREAGDGSEEILSCASELSRDISRELEEDMESIIADHRYGFSAGVIRETVTRIIPGRGYLSDRADSILTHRLLGPVILVAVLWGMYQFTFGVSRVPVGWVSGAFVWMHHFAWSILPDGLIRSMVVSGVIDGVGGVIGFVPLIMFMFFFIALLEDSGYMARVAFNMDRVFRIFGLHGSSIVPLIVSGGISGGCAVPGIMATRTLRDPKERLATILSAPFMNCGAKLPIYAVLIDAFFSRSEGSMMFAVTVLSWVFALISARVLRSTILRGESTPFVMELPPYRLPTFRTVLIHTWERTWLYLKKAGTIILLASVIVWMMMTFPRLNAAELEGIPEAEAAARELSHSAAGRIGRTLESVTKPLMGFDWRTDVALIGGFAGKEIVVSTLGTTYSLGELDPGSSTSLAERLASEPGWNPLTAFALIVFTMLYVPCVATIAVIRRETRSWRWAAFATIYTTAVAAFTATVVYQGGHLLGIGL